MKHAGNQPGRELCYTNREMEGEGGLVLRFVESRVIRVDVAVDSPEERVR